MSSLVIDFNVNVFTYHLLLQCLHSFLGVISGRKTESMRDFYLCYPAILINTLVPQLGLSSILQNQLGVALDALIVVITHYVTILMPILSYFTRFARRGRMPAAGILGWKGENIIDLFCTTPKVLKLHGSQFWNI